MAKGHVWTYTSSTPYPEEVDYFPNWSVWTSLKDMREHIVQVAWDDITEGFDRGLSDKELISIRDQVNKFIEEDVRKSQENVLKITLDNDGDEEEYFVIRVWSMNIM